MSQCIIGDSLIVLPTLASGSVQTCVTSPPYWGLRDYGCAGQLGLEPTPEEYVDKMVLVFREVRRVLRDDGTLWLNLGDSYARAPEKGGSGPGGKNGYGEGYSEARAALRGMQRHNEPGMRASSVQTARAKSPEENEVPPMSSIVGSSDGKVGRAARPGSRTSVQGLEAKQLVGIPWRVAFALQADGWFLRQDIIWNKPNSMPESVRDRCTKSHEYILLLTKSARYYYDADAIREPYSESMLAELEEKYTGEGIKDYEAAGVQNPSDTKRRIIENANKRRSSYVGTSSSMDGTTHLIKSDSGLPLNPMGRNKRSVWTVTTKGFGGAHFATFPPDLIEPCILAGSKPGDVVLDCFGGSGTTGQVAEKLGRQWILIELNPDYAKLSENRTAQRGMVFS